MARSSRTPTPKDLSLSTPSTCPHLDESLAGRDGGARNGTGRHWNYFNGQTRGRHASMSDGSMSRFEAYEKLQDEIVERQGKR